MKVLHRYILWQLVRVFLLALIAFTSVFVLVGLVQEASQQGLNPVQILGLVPLVIPASLPYTIPSTLLLAVTVVYGRLAADNEITASKAAGINVLSLAMPAILLGLALSFVTLFLSDRIIPSTNLRMRNILVSNVEDVVYAALKNRHVLKASGLPYEIHAQAVDGKRLINTTFKRKSTEEGYDLVAFAKEASLEFDLAARTVRVHMQNAEVAVGTDSHVGIDKVKVFEMELPNVIDRVGLRELTTPDIETHKAEVIRAHRAACAQWALHSIIPITTGRLGEVQWASLIGLADRGRDAQRQLWRLNLEPHMRRAIAFGCLVFVLLGVPVAILFQRGDYLSAFISCFLPIIVLYYPLLMLGFNLAKEGKADPLIVWCGNALFVVLGLIAFRPVLRY